jgi:hypothetical protein
MNLPVSSVLFVLFRKLVIGCKEKKSQKIYEGEKNICVKTKEPVEPLPSTQLPKATGRSFGMLKNLRCANIRLLASWFCHESTSYGRRKNI